MRTMPLRAAGVLAVATLALVGCAQNPAGGGGGGGGAAAAGGPCERTVQNDFVLPGDKPPAAKANFKVAMVRQSGVGDYFEQWGNGAATQIKAAGRQGYIWKIRMSDPVHFGLMSGDMTGQPRAP